MAVSGNQLTRLGAWLSGVGKKLTILAKSPGVVAPQAVNISTTGLFSSPITSGKFRTAETIGVFRLPSTTGRFR